MLELVRTTVINNTKLVLVGVAAFALGGAGTAASVTLSGDSTPAPTTSQSSNADSTDTTETPEAPDAPEAADSTDATESAEAPETPDAGDTGTRPTDTHGYCVSQAVAAAHAAGKTGKDVSAAAHSCPKPAKSKASDAKSAKSHGKSAKSHGKSAKPHGKASRP